MAQTGFSLTQIAAMARKAIYGAAIGFVVLAIMTYFVRQYQEYQRLHPPALVTKPDYAFGTLPPINFPKGEKAPTKINLEIASGFFPVSPSVLKVFAFKPKKFPGFDPVSSAREFAKQLGFTQDEKKISESEYSFNDPKNSLRTLTINSLTQSFQIKSNLRNDYNLISESGLPAPEEAINFAQSFLQTNSLDNPMAKTLEANPEVTGVLPIPRVEVAELKPTIFYYKLSPLGTLEKTNLPYDANVIQVVFPEHLVDGKRVFFAQETVGPAVFMLTGGEDENDNRIVEMSYAYFSVNEQELGLYPIKEADVAWKELQDGGGYIASLGESKNPIVRSIEIGYFDDLSGQGYLQPVWVFRGDDGFRAYVPAVTTARINSSK